MGALDGIRVVDFTRYLSGPTLTMLLADLGAEVIKVEGLPAGDPARQSGPFDRSESVYFMASNRNKRSLAVDLKRPEGREICHRLIDGADVVAQNFRPGIAEAMGFGYEALSARNPGLVYCNISGFGMVPPGSELPGFDQTAQAMSGLMSVTGTPDTGPLRVGIAIADSAAGVAAAVGVLAALFARTRTGRGCVVNGSLMETMLTLLSYQAQKYLSLGTVPGQDGNDHPIMFPQGSFRTRDGAITLASGNEKMWRRLCTALDLESIAEDQRFQSNASRMANRVELRHLIEARLEARTTSEWLEVIGGFGVPCSPVLNVREALEHPITGALQMVAETEHTSLGAIKVLGAMVKVDGDQHWLRLPPPVLGEHTHEVCAEAGYSDQEIQELFSSGVVAGPELKAEAM
ncbi:MAG TPA: CoA transferase [Actinomycetes bacterium]|jgi:crotonobetainyl-CoA:carnitine CoA-transferase CaiB-like acyl-CoA transferase|nr:CoA transferase [Actinomycetes bacterium]